MSQRRSSPTDRATRRSRRPPQRSASFLERNRHALLWAVGILGFAVLVLIGFVLPAVTPAYTCGNAFNPTPTPPFVAPSQAPTASGATPAPAVTAAPPGFVQPDMGKNHGRPGGRITWTSCPPASGRHYEAPNGPVPGGIYGPGEEARAPGWVHNFEHGAIALLYNCDLAADMCTDTGQKTLEDLLARWPDSPICKIPPGGLSPVIAPFKDMPYPFAAIVWDMVLPLQTLDEAAIFQFYAAYGERFAPEPGCPAPTPTPGPTNTPGPSPAATQTAAPTIAPTDAPSGSGSAAPTASPAASG